MLAKRLAICAQFIQVHRKQEWAHFTNYVDWLTEVNPPKLRGRPPGSKNKPKKN